MQRQAKRERASQLISLVSARATGQPRFCLVPLAALSNTAGALGPGKEPSISKPLSHSVSKTPQQKGVQLHRHPLFFQPLPSSLAPWHTLPYCRQEVHHLAGLLRQGLAASFAQLRHSWQRQRQAARDKRARHTHHTTAGKSTHGRHRHGLRLYLPWRKQRDKAHVDQQSSTESQQPAALAYAAEQRGLARQKALDVRGAIAAFEEAASIMPNDVRILACLSKQWSDITFIPDTPKAEGKMCAEKGVSLAGKAIEMDPHCALAHIAAGVARGRLAFFVDNRTKVKLAAAAQKDALAALAADPDSDLAHHLLGRWHSEMAQLNFVVRAMIRVVFGAALEPGTHQEALAAYQRAVELNPHRLIHRVELARTALRLGQTSLAAQQLQAAEGLEVEDVNAYLTRLDALQMMANLRRQGKLEDSVQPTRLAELGGICESAATDQKGC